MSNAARDGPVRILANELRCMRCRVRMGCAVRVAFKGDRGYSDERTLRQPLFQIVVFRLACGQALPPAVVVDHDTDIVRVVEGCRGAIERRVVERPFRRRDLPDELMCTSLV